MTAPGLDRTQADREPPPLRLREHRRLVPELALPVMRRSAPRATRRAPLYCRLLRLRHVHPNGWQRAVLAEGAVVAAVIVVLAGVATAWTVLVLPLVVALVVKGHDVLAGSLEAPRRRKT